MSDEKIKKSYKDTGTYLLNGEFESSVIIPCIEWILSENAKAEHKELNLIINSPGGYVFELFGLVDVVNGSKIPINTYGIGCIASCGLVLFLQGKKRILTPNTYIMSHQHSEGRYGKYHELLASRKSEDWMHERLIHLFGKSLNMKKKKIKELFFTPTDVFLTAEEAKKYGIATEIKYL